MDYHLHKGGLSKAGRPSVTNALGVLRKFSRLRGNRDSKTKRGLEGVWGVPFGNCTRMISRLELLISPTPVHDDLISSSISTSWGPERQCTRKHVWLELAGLTALFLLQSPMKSNITLYQQDRCLSWPFWGCIC